MRVRPALVILLAGLASCSPAAAPVRAISDYFPLGEGAIWTWRVSLPAGEYEERWVAESVETTGPGRGRTFVVGWRQRFPSQGESEFTRMFDSVDHYIVAADGSHVAHHFEVTDLAAYPVPGWRQDLEEDEASWLLREDARPGVPIEIEREVFAGAVEKIVYTVLARDATVTVPAGTFEDCLHLRIEEDSTQESPAPFASHTVVEWWFAPHVGPVRRTTGRDAEPGRADGETERVLLDFDLARGH